MPSDASVLALHGFTQTGAMWDEIAEACGGVWVAPDLPGHGGPPVPDWPAAVAWVSGLAAGLRVPRILVGYSMGGRLALGALAAGVEVDGAVIVSAAAGISDPAGRADRMRADADLAATIRSSGIEAFVDDWLARPMFAGLGVRSDAWRAADRAVRVAHDAELLAAALETLGQGAQPPLLEHLRRVTVPVEWVVGARDVRYRGIAETAAARLGRATVTVVEGAGHAVVAERPGEVAAVIARMRRLVLGGEHTFD